MDQNIAELEKAYADFQAAGVFSKVEAGNVLAEKSFNALTILAARVTELEKCQNNAQ